MLMKLRDALALQNAVTQLDTVSKATGEPIFAFKGAVRLSLTTTVRSLRETTNDYVASRKRLEAEMKIQPKTATEDPELWAKFDAALGEMLDAEVDVKLGAKIKTADLDLDRNPMTSTLILSLAPVLLDPL